MNKEDYVSYDLALALKAAGFDEPCDHYWSKEFANSDKMVLRQASADDYNNDDWDVSHCSAPHIYQAQKWLRERKGIAINVDAHDGDFYTWEAVFLSNASQNVVIEASLSAKFSPYVQKHGCYECALSTGIVAALELIKKGE